MFLEKQSDETSITIAGTEICEILQFYAGSFDNPRAKTAARLHYGSYR